MTHEDLRKRAIRWLTNTKHCGVVLSEIVSASMETPDAVGWQEWSSFLVECKVSRSDFRAQQDKSWMRSGRGVGGLRWYMVPTGLIRPEEIEGDWGLLWVDSENGMVREKKAPTARAADCESEIRMLVSALRRIKTREFIILVPDANANEPCGDEAYPVLVRA